MLSTPQEYAQPRFCSAPPRPRAPDETPVLEQSSGQPHETACILNAGDVAAHVRITGFFADRDPVGPYLVTVEPRRTLHLRFNDLDRPAPIPRDTPYSSVFESDAPIVVQHTRLDSRRAEVSLLSTIAYAEASPR
jgi:hypothetical protein